MLCACADIISSAFPLGYASTRPLLRNSCWLLVLRSLKSLGSSQEASAQQQTPSSLRPEAHAAVSSDVSKGRSSCELLNQTAESLRDLRFVCAVNWAIASLRRPFSFGCTVIAASAGATHAAYAAALYLHALAVPLWVGTHSRNAVRQDRHCLLRQLLQAVREATVARAVVVVIAPASLMKDASQLVLLQHFVVHCGLAGASSPEALLQAYSGQLEELADTLSDLGLAGHAYQVSHRNTPLHMVAAPCWPQGFTTL
jgi:hypothetical protein